MTKNQFWRGDFFPSFFSLGKTLQHLPASFPLDVLFQLMASTLKVSSMSFTDTVYARHKLEGAQEV